CKEYDQIIKDNPIDVQLLGIGRNGHIAFNEPGTPFDIGTHEVKLTENTIKANSRFFDNEDEVPKSAICMGNANIMQAKKVVLMAFGEKKAQAIKEMIEGPVTEQVPASILQKHPDVTIIVDKAAAQELDDNLYLKIKSYAFYNRRRPSYFCELYFTKSHFCSKY